MKKELLISRITQLKNKAETVFHNKTIFSSEWWFLTALCSIATALVYLFAVQLMALHATQVLAGILPQVPVSTHGDKIKRDFLAFVCMQVFFILRLIIPWGYSVVFQKSINIKVNLKVIIFGLVSCVSILLLVSEPFLLIFIGIALFCFIFSFLLSYKTNSSQLQPFKTLSTPQQIIIGLFLAIVLITPGLYAWYPIILPNDFYEAEEQLVFRDAEPKRLLTKTEALAYLESNRVINDVHSDVPQNAFFSQDAKNLLDTFQSASAWQAETGRLYFHHSYLYTPATHWLKYGFDGNILYLYGYGNTVFHSILMATYQAITNQTSTLTSYFNTYPVALLLGIFIITCSILYCSSNFALALLAFIICLTEMYAIGFNAAFMAGGSFSSMRYVGLCLQICSVFFCLRGSSKRLLALPSAAFVSLFWNMEFGVFGLLSQGLVLLSPTLGISRLKRFLYILTLFLSLGIYFLFWNAPSTALQNIYLGFYQVWSPSVIPYKMVNWILIIVSIQILAIISTFTYQTIEKVARLSVLPTIMLVFLKAIYNPSFVHMTISLAFILPMLLLYIPNITHIKAFIRLESKSFFVKYLAVIFMTVFCITNGIFYIKESRNFKKNLLTPYTSLSWSSLHETIPTVVPEKMISERLAAINHFIQKTDSLLLLSPYDCVLNFYVNPSKYIGGFELLSNIVQKANEEQVYSQIEQADNVLVVYDKSLLTPCVSSIFYDFSTKTCTSNRYASKKRVHELFLKLMPLLQKIGEEGELTFYRKKYIRGELLIE